MRGQKGEDTPFQGEESRSAVKRRSSLQFMATRMPGLKELVPPQRLDWGLRGGGKVIATWAGEQSHIHPDVSTQAPPTKARRPSRNPFLLQTMKVRLRARIGSALEKFSDHECCRVKRASAAPIQLLHFLCPERQVR